MDINNEIVELVTQIEYIIGSECFNSKSTWQHGNRIIQGRNKNKKDRKQQFYCA